MLAPKSFTQSMGVSIGFYVDILGFACLNSSDSWASLGRDDVEVMLSLPNADSPLDQFTGSFYFRTDDVEAWWHWLKDSARIVYPIENFFYGMREFAIEDDTY